MRPPDDSVAGRPSSIGKRLFLLGPRLSLCASMVREQVHLADIGTDHGYLPVWLAVKGKIHSAVAADIRHGPLGRARENINRFGVSEFVSARLSDGLDAIRPEEVDDIVIAGMGGILQAQILSRAAWLKSGEKHLILQPMTSVEELRLFLAGNGFAVRKEQAAVEGGHAYTVMLAVYSPLDCQADKLYPYIGKLDASTRENRIYLETQVRRLGKQARGLRISGSGQRADELTGVIREIQRILKPKQEDFN